MFHVLYMDGSCASVSISGFQTGPSRELNLLMCVWSIVLSSITFYGPGERRHDSASRRLIDKQSRTRNSGSLSEQPGRWVCARVKPGSRVKADLPLFKSKCITKCWVLNSSII